MDITTILILVLIGATAGVLSGFVGIGGGVIVVPALIFFLGLTQHQAQGTSIALMLPPIGILAAYNYYKTGNLNISYAVVIAIAFILGAYLGSKLSLSLPQNTVKRIFGIIMLLISIRLILTK
jgi:uncharacterized protein